MSKKRFNLKKQDDDSLEISDEVEQSFDTTIEDLFKKRKKYITKASLMSLLLGLVIILIVSLFIYISQSGSNKIKRTNTNIEENEFNSDIDEANIWKYEIRDKIINLNKKLLDFKKETLESTQATQDSVKSGISEINDRLNSSLDEIRSLLEDQNNNVEVKMQDFVDELNTAKSELQNYTNNSIKNALDGIAPSSNTIQVVNPGQEKSMLPIPSIVDNSKIKREIESKLKESSDKLTSSLEEITENLRNLVSKVESDEQISDEMLLKYSDLYDEYNLLSSEKQTLTGSDNKQLTSLINRYKKISKSYKKIAKDLQKIDSHKYSKLINKYNKLSSKYGDIESDYTLLKTELNKKPRVTERITRVQTKLISPDKKIYEDFGTLSNEYQKVLYELQNESRANNEVLQKYAELSQDFKSLSTQYQSSRVRGGDLSDKYDSVILKYKQLSSGYNDMANDLESINRKKFKNIINKYNNLSNKYDEMSQQYTNMLGSVEEEEKERFVEITQDDERMFADVEIDTVDQNKYDDLKSTLSSYNEEEEEELGDFHIMTGFAKAMLLTGVSAPTFGSGILNPKPVLFSISSNLVIANDDYEDLKDCLLIGTATGNMNTERAEVQITKISCSIRGENGRRLKIEKSGSPLGWIIGEDGKYGLKGRLVDSAGKVVMRELSIGFLQGVYSAFSNSTSSSSIFGAGTTSQSPITNGLQVGTSSALDKLASYYEKMLDGMYPFIDIKAGRYVTVLFNGGEDIRETKYQRIKANRATGSGDVDTNMEVDIDGW